MRQSILYGRQRLERWIEVATLSPTSFNLQHWRFVVIDAREQLQLILDGLAARQGKPLPTAVIFVCARIAVWRHVLDYNEHLPATAKERVARNCNQVYGGNERVQRDEAYRTSGLVAMTLMEFLRGEGVEFSYLPDPARYDLASVLRVESDTVVACAIVLEASADMDAGRSVQRAAITVVKDGFPAHTRHQAPATIRWRRAIRHFDRNYRLCDRSFAQIVAGVDALHECVPAGSIFIVDVEEIGLRESIARVGFSQPQYLEASKILILCYASCHAAGVQTGHDYQASRDAAMICAGLVAQKVMLGASMLEIDSCPMIGFDFDAVGRLIRKPPDCLVLMIVALGRRREDPPPRAARLAVESIVAYNTLKY